MTQQQKSSEITL